MAGILGTTKKITAENLTATDLKNVKNEIIDELCNALRDVANSNEDFFIIKEHEDHITVGAKIYLPTVEQEVDY